MVFLAIVLVGHTICCYCFIMAYISTHTHTQKKTPEEYEIEARTDPEHLDRGVLAFRCLLKLCVQGEVYFFSQSGEDRQTAQVGEHQTCVPQTLRRLGSYEIYASISPCGLLVGGMIIRRRCPCQIPLC